MTDRDEFLSQTSGSPSLANHGKNLPSSTRLILDDLIRHLHGQLKTDAFVFYDPIDLIEFAMKTGKVLQLQGVPYNYIVNMCIQAYHMVASVEPVRLAHQVSASVIQEWCIEHSVRGLVGYTGWHDWRWADLPTQVYFSDPTTAFAFVMKFS